MNDLPRGSGMFHTGRLRFRGALRRYLSDAQVRIVEWILLGLLASVGALVIVLGGMLAGGALAISGRLPPVDALYTPPSEATRIYAANGELVASLYRENRDSISLAEVPKALQRAVIDTEDADFYHHHGISLRGVLRASFHNVREGAYAEGGSTITQQLARNLFLRSEKSLSRKIGEMLLAIQIERRLTKDEILERYLNQVYFGQGAYGVETAAQVYFAKQAKDLTLAQCLLLAGMIRAPSVYSPYEHPDRAATRTAEVAQRMVDLGDLTPQGMASVLAAPLDLAEQGEAGLIGVRAPYFVSYILPSLIQRYGEDVLYKGGLRIYTTLDLTLQAEAEAALQQGIADALRRHLDVHQGALIVLDPRTGYIRAMIGGYDFRESQFNRAWQARRQPGSAFKPFTYTAALMRGIPPTHLLLDEPIEFKLSNDEVWTPENYDKTWHGVITARYALENSINVASIRLEQEVGPEAIVNIARRMGITSPIHPHLSLTLGTSDVTLLEMASAYSVFASGGIRAAPMGVVKVTDWRGKILEEHVPQRQVVLSPEVAYLMTDLLKGVILRGTGTAAYLGIPEAGKTGTADDYRNAWFIGFTPYLVTAVWIGNDDDSPMNHVVGGAVPAQIWATVMRKATQGMPRDDWPRPEGIVQITVSGNSGLLAGPGCPNPHPELFIKGTEPESYDVCTGAPAGAPPGTPAATPAPPGPGQPDAGQGGLPTVIPGVTPEPAVSGHASFPVTLIAPKEGSQVTPPFTVQGTTRPGATVHIVAYSVNGVVRAQVADVYLQADQGGSFVSQVTPWVKPSGTVVITAIASVGAETASTSVSVQVQ